MNKSELENTYRVGTVVRLRGQKQPLTVIDTDMVARSVPAVRVSWIDSVGVGHDGTFPAYALIVTHPVDGLDEFQK